MPQLFDLHAVQTLGKTQTLNLKQNSIFKYFNEHLKQKTKVTVLLPNLELDH